jgi:septum formation protein
LPALLQAPAPRLILASASTARRNLLQSAGLQFDCIPADIDESAIKVATRAGGGTASDAAAALAIAKAAAIPAPDAIVIGCDQILVCGDAWFDKPATLADARDTLCRLRGRPHTLVTATACHRAAATLWQHVATPRLTMRAFSDAFLDAYLAAEGAALLTSVGAYRLEGAGMHLFDAIEGEHSAILGLPMTPLLGFLRASGVVLA